MLKSIQGVRTAAECIDRAGLNWATGMYPLRMVNPDTGEVLPVPGQYAHVRTDKNAVLGIVGQRYHAVENREVFDWFDEIAAADGLEYVAAGTLDHGRSVFVQAKAPAQLFPGTPDAINKLVTVINHHGGHGGQRIGLVSVRIVCKNTQAMAWGQCQAQGIRHTEGVRKAMWDARKKIGLVLGSAGQFGTWAQRAADQPMSGGDIWEKVLSEAFDTDPSDKRSREALQRRVAEVEELAARPTNQTAMTEGTAYGAYTALAEWADHSMKGYKGDEARREEARLESRLMGRADRIKRRAAELVGAAAGLEGSDWWK